MKQNSDRDSPKPPMPSSGSTLVFRLEVPGRLPSWNEVLGMGLRARMRLKKQQHAAFESAARESAGACSIQTIAASSTRLMHFGGMESSRMIQPIISTSLSPSAKPPKARPRKPSSKCGK